MSEPESTASPSIDELVAREDVDGLLRLGAAHQSGVGAARDLFAALECFEAAARFGSHEAEYLVGVFHLNGFGIARDVAEGAKRLRNAAQMGSLRGKIYVANLYEMGVHYAADREKADVWYRNVARAAGIEDETDSPTYDLAMAELGCVRHCLKLIADDALPNKDRAHFLKKAKSMGYGQRLTEARREVARAVEAETPIVAEATTPDAPSEPRPPEADPHGRADEDESKTKKPTDAEPEDAPALGSRWTVGTGLVAVVGATFFAAAATLTAYLAQHGVAASRTLPDPLPRLEQAPLAVYLGVVLLLGVLPATALYRPRVVAVATLLGGGGAAGGWYAFEHLAWLETAALSASAAGLAVYLGTLLFLGLVGGTRIGR